MKSFKVEVKTTDPYWQTNFCRFNTAGEAEAYALDLKQRWRLVSATRVLLSDEPANYRWIDGRLAYIWAPREKELAQ